MYNKVTNVNLLMNLTTLEELHLSYNELALIPPSVSKLVHLQSLEVDGNNLKILPLNMYLHCTRFGSSTTVYSNVL